MQTFVLGFLGVTVLGIALRAYFWYASVNLMAGRRAAQRNDDGLSFDERVAQRLREAANGERRYD